MERLLSLSLIIILCICLVACSNHGNIDNAEIVYSNSDLFSEMEIKSAIDAVLIKFADFTGCELIKIRYDEDVSSEIIQRDILSVGSNTIKSSGAEPENIIILLSDFKTSKTNVAGQGFETDSIYTDWNWILIRDSKTDEWKLTDWGY